MRRSRKQVIRIITTTSWTVRWDEIAASPSTAGPTAALPADDTGEPGRAAPAEQEAMDAKDDPDQPANTGLAPT